MIQDTNYTLQHIKDSSWIKVLRDNIQIAMCMNEEACLHSIWIGEGLNPNHFFVVNKGDVKRVLRDCL